jgi:manganese transport protein
MAGQIVMEGFLNFRMRPWLRRLITRIVAIIPAVFTIVIAGEEGTYQLLILSQVILSMQLPFAIVPLIHFTSERKWMGEFANSLWVRLLAWSAAAIIIGLNIWLVVTTIREWIADAGHQGTLVMLITIPIALLLLLLLLWVVFEPVLPEVLRHLGRRATTMPEHVGTVLETPAYRRILVPLDHTELDHSAVAHGAAMAKSYGAKLYLLHVEEGVTSVVYGPLASTAEVEAGEQYLEGIVSKLREQGIDVEAVVRHSNRPRQAIIDEARSIEPDLLIMGAHGHRGLKDLIFGTTINAVRHALGVPILIVRRDGRV